MTTEVRNKNASKHMNQTLAAELRNSCICVMKTPPRAPKRKRMPTTIQCEVTVSSSLTVVHRCDRGREMQCCEKGEQVEFSYKE